MVELYMVGMDGYGTLYPKMTFSGASIDAAVKNYLNLYPSCIHIILDVTLTAVLSVNRQAEIDFRTRINPDHK